MTNFFEREKKEINIADKGIESPSIDLTEVQNRIDATNDDANDQAVIERTKALEEIDALEKKTGINMDETQGAIAKQIQALKEAGAKFHALAKNMLGSGKKDVDVTPKKSTYIEYIEPLKEKASQKSEGIRMELLKHIASHEYLKKLEVEFNGNVSKAKKAQKERVDNLKSVKITIISHGSLVKRYMTEYKKSDENVGGFYDSEKHEIVIPIVDDIGAALHELLHASVRRLNSDNSNLHKLYILSAESYKHDPDDALRDGRYYSNPYERLARKQVLDLELERLGIKKYGERFTDTHYEKMMKLYKREKLSRDAMEFIQRTDPKYFKQIMNEIAANELEKMDEAA